MQRNEICLYNKHDLERPSEENVKKLWCYHSYGNYLFYWYSGKFV